MIEPKRVLRALAEHWALLEPLCEHFDQGTLSLGELRAQLAAQQLDSTPQDITNLLDVWIRLDILVPVAKSPNRFELNAQIHDFLAYLRKEHRLGLCLEIEAYLRHLERLAGYIQDAFDIRDGHDLARQLRLLDMRVRDVLKKLAQILKKGSSMVLTIKFFALLSKETRVSSSFERDINYLGIEQVG